MHSLKNIFYIFIFISIFILTGELAVIHCLSNSFSSRYYNYFLQYAAIHSLNGDVHFSDVKIATIQSGYRIFFQLISEH